MNFLISGESVDKPCREILSHPFQCFQELFLATPGIVGTFFVGIGGFVVAVAIWGLIFALALYALYFTFKHVCCAGRYVFTQTKVGRNLAHYIPIGSCLRKFCSKAQEVQPKKLINTQAIGDYGANIVSKVHVDSKWFKGAFKHFPFGSKGGDTQNNHTTPQKCTPQKSPQKSSSKLAALTPKILSPKLLKQS